MSRATTKAKKLPAELPPLPEGYEYLGMGNGGEWDAFDGLALTPSGLGRWRRDRGLTGLHRDTHYAIKRREKPSAMTPEAQRIAIAEAVGYWFGADEDSPEEYWHHPEGGSAGCLPDYLGSLDAMHEAENTLPVVQRSFYCNHLMFGVPVHEPSGIFGHWQTVNATPPSEPRRSCAPSGSGRRPPMPDELDQLSDAALSERVAVECLGWVERDSSFEECQWEMPDGERCALPPFATSADAVLPILAEHCEKTGDAWRALGKREVVFILSPAYSRVHLAPGILSEWGVKAPTFARAACIALLRAKRAEKGGAK